MTEAEVITTYRIEPAEWVSMRQTLTVPEDLQRKGRAWLVTEAGRTKICRALARAGAPPSDLSSPDHHNFAPDPPNRRGYLLPLHAGPAQPIVGAVFDMKIERCWPAISNDRIVLCLLPGTDPGNAANFVPVRLLGPANFLHNYRSGMVLRARLESDGVWQALRPAPNQPGRWTNDHYASL